MTRNPSAFVFERYRYDRERRLLCLHYRFADGPRFVEEIEFDFVPRTLGGADEAVLDGIFRLILLFAGVSYYKAFIPQTLICEAFPLDPHTAAFALRFYERGLGEFAFRNRVSLAGRLNFRTEPVDPPMPIAIDPPHRSCVPVGGGKDSIVTLESLRQAGEEIVLFALGDAAPIAACIAASGLPSIRVRRRLDPALFALNRAGALNGHVPITGILSAIAVAAALLYGCDAVVMSNEHSASAPNLEIDGVSINHQYSKSFEFEAEFADYLHAHVSPGIAYFSLLRPLSEIAIARRFARYPQYFPVFRSCNTAFKQRAEERGRQWCGDCPKCRFVFLALAPFVGKSALLGIFGRNLLDDPGQIDGFAALCGQRGHKPFECVGETAECAAVMAELVRRGEWREDAVVRAFDCAETGSGEFRALFAMRGPHRVPEKYMAMLDAGG
jgi:hypothetical protein